jgi:hypothetical protein
MSALGPKRVMMIVELDRFAIKTSYGIMRSNDAAAGLR